MLEQSCTLGTQTHTFHNILFCLQSRNTRGSGFITPTCLRLRHRLGHVTQTRVQRQWVGTSPSST